MTITVTQFGLTPASGSLSNIVDGNPVSGWAPGATNLSAYPAPFLTSTNALNVGNSFAGLQFDFGESTRVAMFRPVTQTGFTLGDACIIASDNPATSVSNMLQSGDQLLGVYTAAEMNGDAVLRTAAASADIRGRYLRVLQHAFGAEIGGTVGPAPGVPADGLTNVRIYDTPGEYDSETVPTFTTKLVIEGWGGGATGGDTHNGADGGDTNFGVESSFVCWARGGDKASASGPNLSVNPGAGGAASGGDVNTTGNPGLTPSPASSLPGQSGDGGAAPNGGAGGAGVFNDYTAFMQGQPGQAPGGAGSGHNRSTSIAGGTFYKYPGGGSGGYVKKTFLPGGLLDPGDPIGIVVGAGGDPGNTGNGAGANGRVKMSWT